MVRSSWSLLRALSFVLALAGCSLPSDSGFAGSIRVEPAEVEIFGRATQTFAAVVEGIDAGGVVWTVSGGTFVETAEGIDWTAPDEPGEYTVTAAIAEDPRHSGVALVRVLETEGTGEISFAGYRGTASTLPAGMFVGGENGAGREVDDGYDPFTGVSRLEEAGGDDTFDGFSAFTRDDQTFSFGIRERGAADLREARLFLAFVNTTGRPIRAFHVAYDVEVWRLGERGNRIRLKYHTDTRGFSDIHDLASTSNPRGAAEGAAVGMAVDGKLPENRTRTSLRIELAETIGPGGATYPNLAPGDTAYFRWQYSNEDDDEGSVRSALALGDIRIVPVYSDEPPPTTTEPLAFSHEAGFYTAPFLLEIASVYTDATIYYTIDGSVPDPSRVMDDEAWLELPVHGRRRTLVHDGPIDIGTVVATPAEIALIPTSSGALPADEFPPWVAPASEVFRAAVVRAAVVRDGRVEASATRSYFLDPQGRGRYPLPVVSLAADRTELFGPERGIYVEGNEWEPNYDGRGDEWERIAHFELFDAANTRPLAQEIGVRIHGGATRKLPQKSLRLYARSELGTARFRYPFFESKPQQIDFNRLLLRNAGNDWGYARMRDRTLQSLVHHLPFDTQHDRPAIVFLNGEYWGIHAFRDRLDQHYVETHYDVPRDRVTILELDAEVAEGRPDGAQPYLDFLDRLKAGEFITWSDVDAFMDLNGYLDYVIAQVYSANADWPGNNIAWWRYEGPDFTEEAGPRDGRWRWMMFDVDFSFGRGAPVEDHLLFDIAHGVHAWAFDLFRGVTEIPAIRAEFLQRTAVHLSTTFETSRVRDRVAEYAAALEPVIEENIARWPIPSSAVTWEGEIGIMQDFAARRPGVVRDQVVQWYPEVTGDAQLEVANLDNGSDVSLHSVPLAPAAPGVVVTNGRWSGRLFTGVPVAIRSGALDLRSAEVTGAVRDLVRTADEVRFVLEGDARISLP